MYLWVRPLWKLWMFETWDEMFPILYLLEKMHQYLMIFFKWFAFQARTTFDFIFISDLTALEYKYHILPYHIAFVVWERLVFL